MNVLLVWVDTEGGPADADLFVPVQTRYGCPLDCSCCATADLLSAHGIRRKGLLLLGGPGETRDTARGSLASDDDLLLPRFHLAPGIDPEADRPGFRPT